jgi:hypothetical protein
VKTVKANRHGSVEREIHSDLLQLYLVNGDCRPGQLDLDNSIADFVEDLRARAVFGRLVTNGVGRKR